MTASPLKMSLNPDLCKALTQRYSAFVFLLLSFLIVCSFYFVILKQEFDCVRAQLAEHFCALQMPQEIGLAEEKEQTVAMYQSIT